MRLLVYRGDFLGWGCPVNEDHRVSANAEPGSYYCYECRESYGEPPKAERRAIELAARTPGGSR